MSKCTTHPCVVEINVSGYKNLILIRLYYCNHVLFSLKGKEAQADRCRKALAGDSPSDHIMLLKAFKVYLVLWSSQTLRNWFLPFLLWEELEFNQISSIDTENNQNKIIYLIQRTQWDNHERNLFCLILIWSHTFNPVEGLSIVKYSILFFL